ncbi:MAG: hypothetical protein L6V80_06295 [Bacteroidales bacterium]|nr:MAG: hypothetical protein L6V80_06295 [Bacteroidales bacterium]
MNEIKKCSIAGVSFTLEYDAYDALNAYIESLNDTYKDDPAGEEIIADIEARIAEPDTLGTARRRHHRPPAHR